MTYRSIYHGGEEPDGIDEFCICDICGKRVELEEEFGLVDQFRLADHELASAELVKLLDDAHDMKDGHACKDCFDWLEPQMNALEMQHDRLVELRGELEDEEEALKQAVAKVVVDGQARRQEVPS